MAELLYATLPAATCTCQAIGSRGGTCRFWTLAGVETERQGFVHLQVRRPVSSSAIIEPNTCLVLLNHKQPGSKGFLISQNSATTRHSVLRKQVVLVAATHIDAMASNNPDSSTTEPQNVRPPPVVGVITIKTARLLN